MRLAFALVAALIGVAHAQPASVTLHTGSTEVTAYGTAAFAVCSLRYRNVEYLDAADHGRCMQSASSFDWMGEAFNPTQAGSAADGAIANPSSSQVKELAANGASLSTVTRMVYWNSVAGVKTSAHVLRQIVMTSLGPHANVIRYDVSFEIPAGEYHNIGQFEILTGYMPQVFSHFRTFDPASGQLAELSDGPGEQAMPVIFCTTDDRNCMGVVSVEPLASGGYGRWRFTSERVVKWNAVTRIASPSGSIRRTVYVSVGNLSAVMDAMRWSSAQEKL